MRWLALAVGHHIDVSRPRRRAPKHCPSLGLLAAGLYIAVGMLALPGARSSPLLFCYVGCVFGSPLVMSAGSGRRGASRRPAAPGRSLLAFILLPWSSVLVVCVGYARSSEAWTQITRSLHVL